MRVSFPKACSSSGFLFKAIPEYSIAQAAGANSPDASDSADRGLYREPKATRMGVEVVEPVEFTGNGEAIRVA